MYCPAGTPNIVNVPSARVSAPAVSNSFMSDALAPGSVGIKRTPTFAAGPDGPATLPVTVTAATRRNCKSTPLRSSPDFTMIDAACAAVCADG
jgi:hypothetical protein